MASLVTVWPMVALGNLMSQDTRYVSELEPRMYPKLSVKWWGKGAVLDTPADGATVRMSRHQLARAGQVIVSEIWAKHGSIGIVPDEGAGALVTSHFFLFDMDTSCVLPQYMRYLIEANYLTPLMADISLGTTSYAAIRPQEFLSAEVPLPSLDEQRRIVARIEALAARIAEARGLRREAMVEAEALWRAECRDTFQAVASVTTCMISDIAEVRGGIQKGPHRVAGSNPVRYLTVAHVLRNRILLTDPRYFEVAPDELERWQLKPGDVLIIEGNGSAEQIGRTALFRAASEPFVHQNHVIRIRPEQGKVRPEYLNVYLNSPAGQEEVQRRSRTTSGLRILSIGRINSIVIPLPALPEQDRIVAYLDEVQVKVDALKRTQAETEAELDALLPSILDRAFRGEL